MNPMSSKVAYPPSSKIFGSLLLCRMREKDLNKIHITFPMQIHSMLALTFQYTQLPNILECIEISASD